MNIIEAITDKNLFRPFLADRSGSIESWQHWLVLLRSLTGLPITDKAEQQLIRECTARDPAKMPKKGFQTACYWLAEEVANHVSLHCQQHMKPHCQAESGY